MHHLRNHVRSNIQFVSNTDDAALARVYAKFGMPCGDLTNDQSLDFYTIEKENGPYVRFLSSSVAQLPCEIQGVRSIRVGMPP